MQLFYTNCFQEGKLRENHFNFYINQQLTRTNNKPVFQAIGCLVKLIKNKEILFFSRCRSCLSLFWALYGTP